jgi:hypothetical protein
MAMSIETVEIETLAADRPVDDRWTLQWTPIVAGALIACAVSFIMISFGATVGLGVSSAAPTWRDASVALWVLSGIYLILQALISFGCGGYLTGRCRLPYGGTISEDAEKRDGLHGVASWALAVILGAALATLVVMGASRPTRLTQPATTTEPSLLSYEIDHLFRSPRRPPNSDLSPIRAEAGRILLTSSSHSGVSPDDRAYLAQLVSATTGLSGADAEHRVDNVISESKTAISRTRASTIILAFSVAAALLLGAIAAWTGAEAGGRHRDGTPLADWMEHSNWFNRRRGRWQRPSAPLPS